ncbi:MAG: sigma-70 family RNA polymerase sigma factor [Chloroflexi bacterium]|nr:sigma-70 family RNA polymerase sigma factor [Chloroflexota bacterium]
MHDVDDLVRKAQQGDGQAFAGLYELLVDKVYRYMRVRVSNTAEAEDLTQEAFLRVLEGLPSYTARGRPFAAWVFRIAHNLVVDRYRSKSNASEMVPLEEMPALPAHQDVEETAIRTLDAEQLRRAVRHLTDLQRQTVELRFIAGLSLAETAAVMDRNENAIKALQHSAVQALRRLLVPQHSQMQRAGDEKADA